MDAQQPWKKKGGTASWMAAAGALESGDSELEPRLQLLRGHARVSLLAMPADRRAVGVARQFLQPRLSRTVSKLAKSNLLDTKQGG